MPRSDAAKAKFPDALLAYLRSFKNLYGTKPLVQKHHMALHLIEQSAGTMPACYCLERKHKHVKRFANEVKNWKSDRTNGILREMTARHIAVLKHTDSVHFNVDPCLQNLSASLHRQWSGISCATDLPRTHIYELLLQ